MECIIANGQVEVYEGGECLYRHTLKSAYAESYLFSEMKRIHEEEMISWEMMIPIADTDEWRANVLGQVASKKRRMEMYHALNMHVDAITLAYHDNK